jgi:hypothetical protein
MSLVALSTKYRSNPRVQRETNQTLTIQRKAFANNFSVTVNGVVELTRYIASVSAYIASNRLILEEASLGSVNKNATINLLEENGWDHRCTQQKDFNSANLFTQDKGIPTTKTVSITQSLGSSSIAVPKTMAQLMTQRAALTGASNALPTRDYTGHVVFCDAARTTDAITGKKFMGDNAFANCPRLKSVRVSSDNAWNGFYSNGCFKSCAALTTMNTVTNSNSSMSMNVAVTPPAGTISVAAASATVLGANTFFTILVVGQMLYTSSNTREGAKYIGTVQSIQSNTQLTLALPSALATAYSGTFRLVTEAMIAAHATVVGQEALRGTNIRAVSFESHLNPTLAGSNSRLVSIGSNSFVDCPNLAVMHFSVKQSSALARLGNTSDSVIPLSTNLSVISNDGWSNIATQSQLTALLGVATTRFVVTPKFTYIPRQDSTVLDANNKPMYVATITGIAYQDTPVSFRNLVVPEYIMHSDGILYQVFDIRYPYIDQIETIVGQPNRVYGAFSSNHPAFNVGGQVGALNGTLTMSKTLRSVGSNSFAGQSQLSGNLTVAGTKLTSIGSRCFFNAYSSGRTLTIMGTTTPSIGTEAYRGTSFNPINLRPMTSLELVQYAF